MDLGSFWYELIIFLIVVGLIPAAKIFGKAGYSRWWCFVVLVPVVNVVAYWVFAFARWPILGLKVASNPNNHGRAYTWNDDYTDRTVKGGEEAKRLNRNDPDADADRGPTNPSKGNDWIAEYSEAIRLMRMNSAKLSPRFFKSSTAPR